MIVLITPTGGRPRQFSNCVYWMSRQTYQGSVLWIIVDDCEPITTAFDKKILPENWNVVYRCPKPVWKKGENTQSRNLLEAIQLVSKLPEVKGIFIIEDDDYYSPAYLEVMLEKLKGFDLAGEIKTIYYNLIDRSKYINKNINHSSLFQIVFKRKLIPVFEASCGNKFIDIKFCKAIKNKNLFAMEHPLSVGIKGMSGRAGIGIGHRKWSRFRPDPNLLQLKVLIGEDYKRYYST